MAGGVWEGRDSMSWIASELVEEMDRENFGLAIFYCHEISRTDTTAESYLIPAYRKRKQFAYYGYVKGGAIFYEGIWNGNLFC